MIALLGLGVVIISVLGGFTIAGGKVPALFHISEVLVVGGTALGTVLVSTPGGILKGLLANISLVVRPSPYNKSLYIDALKLLFELYQTAQRDGLVAIESHIEAPESSALFQKYPSVLRQRSAVTFLCDSLRLVLLGSIPPHDLDSTMDSEIEVHHEQESQPVSTLQKVSDALPGIGIVAAVLGVVVTMGAIDGPIEEIGEHVAAALTGTFMGVLLAYGFVGPVATGLEHAKAAEVRFFHFLKASVVASFAEMEAAFKSLKKRPGA
jgi:chemotaxis protein MotA